MSGRQKNHRRIMINGQVDTSWLYYPAGRTFNNLSLGDTPAARRELRQIRGRDLVRTAAEAGARFVVFDSKGQWYAFHNTRISMKYPALGKRDLVAEIIEAGKEYGVVYVPYIPPGYDCRAVREHPEWAVTDINGRRNLKPPHAMVPLCQYGPFRQFMCAYLNELAANYDIGGIWLDGAGSPLCYCPACRQGFKRFSGLELPSLPKEKLFAELEKVKGEWGKLPLSIRKHWRVWARWIDFRDAAARDIVTDYAVAVHRAKPGLPIIADCQFHGWIHGSVYLGQSADLVPVESLFHWTTAQVQCARATYDYKPTESYFTSAQYGPSMPLSLPLQQTRVHAMTALASGSLPIICLHGQNDRLAQVNRELEERSPWILDEREVPYCGLVWSERSRNLHHRAEWDALNMASISALDGNMKILLEEKIPEIAITDRQLEDERALDALSVLILPDIGVLSDRAADNIRRFVRNGGGLVATYKASLASYEFGEPLKDFKLADILGVHYQGCMADETVLESYFGDLRAKLSGPNILKYKMLGLNPHQIVDDPMIQEADAEEVVPVYLRGRPKGVRLVFPDPMLKVRPDRDTNVVIYEFAQAPGHQRPFLTTRSFGKGRAVYIAGDLGRQYYGDVTLPFIRRLMGNAVRWAAGESKPPFIVKAPLHVQATLFRQERQGRLVLHLLNDINPKGYPPFRLSPFQRHKEEPVPVHDLQVGLRGRFHRIYLVPGKKRLIGHFRNGYTWVNILRLETHAMVVGE